MPPSRPGRPRALRWLRGPTSRRFHRIALPASLEALLQSLLFLVDMAILGRLGGDAFAAVGFVNGAVFLLMLCLGAFGGGGAALIAHAAGRREAERARGLVALTVMAGALLGVAAGIAFGLGAELLALALEPPAAALAQTYQRIVAWSVPFLLLQSVLGACLRAVGETRLPFLVATAALAGKGVLTWILVLPPFGLPSLGVAGAAFATLIAEVTSAVALLLGVLSPAGPFALRPRDLIRLERTQLRPLLAVTAPIAAGQGIWAAGSFLYSLLHARLGTGALAASQIVAVVEGTVIRVAFGLAVAALALVGHDLGAGRRRRAGMAAVVALRSGLLYASAGGCVVASASLVLDRLYPAMPGPTLELAVSGLMLSALMMPVRIANLILGTGILRAGGDTAFVMRVDALALAVGLPAAAVLGLPAGGGFAGALAGRALEDIVRLGALRWRWRGGRWNRLDRPSR